jgi:hypothetical protein
MIPRCTRASRSQSLYVIDFTNQEAEIRMPTTMHSHLQWTPSVRPEDVLQDGSVMSSVQTERTEASPPIRPSIAAEPMLACLYTTSTRGSSSRSSTRSATRRCADGSVRERARHMADQITQGLRVVGPRKTVGLPLTLLMRRCPPIHAYLGSTRRPWREPRPSSAALLAVAVALARPPSVNSPARRSGVAPHGQHNDYREGDPHD